MAKWQLFEDNIRDIDEPVMFGVRAELILSLRRLQKLSSFHPGTLFEWIFELYFAPDFINLYCTVVDI